RKRTTSCLNAVRSASFDAPATSQIPAATTRTRSPTQGRAALACTGGGLELGADESIRLLGVRRPEDLSLRVYDVEGRIGLQPVTLGAGPRSALLVEAARRGAGVQEGGERQAEIAFEGVDARSILR